MNNWLHVDTHTVSTFLHNVFIWSFVVVVTAPQTNKTDLNSQSLRGGHRKSPVTHRGNELEGRERVEIGGNVDEGVGWGYRMCCCIEPSHATSKIQRQGRPTVLSLGDRKVCAFRQLL